MTLRPEPGPPAPGGRLSFIDIGRGLGALLVVYSHIQVVWLQNPTPALTQVTDTVSALLLDPLYLPKQGLGQIAVVFFLLASGYLVTPIALRLGSARFTVNRVFRIYPLLIFSVLLAGGAAAVGVDALSDQPGDGVTPSTLLTNALLLNYLLEPGAALLRVTWTLLAAVTFYLMLVVLLPVLRRVIWLAIAVELTLVQVVIALHGPLDGYYAAGAATFSVLVMPIMGQVIWAAQHRKIPLPVAGVYLLIGWLLFVWAASLDASSFDDGYPTAIAVGVLLFLTGVFAEPHLRPRRVWAVLSDRCYSIYLLHGPIAFATVALTLPALGTAPAVLIGLLVTAAVVEVCHRCIESPTHRMGRRLSRPRGTDAAGRGPQRAPRHANRHPGPTRAPVR